MKIAITHPALLFGLAMAGTAMLSACKNSQPLIGRADSAVMAPAREAGPSSPGPSAVGRYGGRFGSRSVDRGGVVMEEMNREAYDSIEETPFLRPTQEPLSTFAVDVDTASYSNVRRMLRDGKLPPAGSVRVEELLNYFPYEYAEPGGEDPLAIDTEVFGCPWEQQHRIVRVGVQGRASDMGERAPANLVFLLDVSGSMNNSDKLPLLKRSLGMLLEELDQRDRVAVVVYAGASGLVLPSTSCDSKDAILSAISRLRAGGSTNGGDGIRLAYKIAQENYIEGGINRVLLATDGDFNVGTSDRSELVRLVQEKAESNVFLTVLGFGKGNLQDATMQDIANRGNGHYAYIDSVLEARKVLVEELGSTLEVIAKDVKIQVEFNPLQVAAYRLIGYENRRLAARDFADDTKDAGEIGAGHRVTALYEIVPAGRGLEIPGAPDLKYQQDRPLSGAAFEDELLHVKLRYKQPEGSVSKLMELAVRDEGTSFDMASDDARFASAVAAFGLVLRESPHIGDASLESVRQWALTSVGDDLGSYRSGFVELVDAAARIDS